MGEDLVRLSIEVDANADQAGKGIDSLSAALGRLNANSKLTRVINNLTKLSAALDQLRQVAGVSSGLNQLAATLDRLGSVQKLKGLNSALNTLKRIPDLIAGLDTANLDKFAAQMGRIKTAVAPLAAEMDKVSRGFSSLPANIRKAIAANQRLTASNKKLRSSYGVLGTGISSFYTKMVAQLYIVRRVADALGTALADFNAYVENVNLFSVSMGKYIDQAYNFSMALQGILGVDASEAMRNMGIIQNLVTSFGVASDQAYVLSKNITQLGYDFASFFNISTSDAFTKLQAAISGELEPIRRLGVDISEARLQQELFALGIDDSVKNLSQADKAILRYIAIMKQTGNAQTDMARTLNSPANMIRVFNAQIDLLARSIGSLLIPMLNALLPPLIAFIQVVREAISSLAAMLGVTIEFAEPGKQIADVGSAISGIGDAASDAKKQMDYLIGGFDELNVLNQDAGSGASGGASGGVLGGVSLPEYDIFDGLVESNVTEWVERMRDALADIGPLVAGIAAGFAAWKIGEGIATLFANAPAIATGFSGIRGAVSGIASGLGFSSVAALAIVAVVAVLVARFAELYAKSEAFRNGIRNVLDLWKTAFKGLSDGFREAFGPAIDAVKNLGSEIANAFPPELKDIISGAFSAVSDAIAQLDLDVGDLLITLAGVVLLFVPGGQIFGAALLGFEAVSVVLRGFGILTDDQMAAIKDTVFNVFKAIGNFIGSVLAAIVTDVTQRFTGIITFLTGVFTGNWEQAWEGLKQLALAPIRGIQLFFEQVFGIDIIDVFKTGINKVIGLLNDFIEWINDHLHFEFDGLTIAGVEIIPAFDFQLFTLPKVPMLADGGVLTDPRLVLAGEYADARSNPEIVTPQKLMRATVEDANASMVSAIVNAIGNLESVIAAQGNGAPVSVTVELDGDEIYANQQIVSHRKGYRVAGNPAFGR